MSENTQAGWFRGLDPRDLDGAREAIEGGSAEKPEAWSALAVESGFVPSEDEYYDVLHAATMYATREAVREAETAEDKQLIHAIRAMDDCERIANELAERVAEWGGSQFDSGGAGIEYARSVAELEDTSEDRLVSLASRVRDLDDETAELRSHVERTAPKVAPNLAALAGPVLAARLIALAGGLKQLARKPAGTVQVLGAEEALFAHLRGRAPSPKHGIIFTHESVSGTHPQHRGSAARALAGKLAIAARIDYYAGDLRPELETELHRRIESIQGRDTE